MYSSLASGLYATYRCSTCFDTSTHSIDFAHSAYCFHISSCWVAGSDLSAPSNVCLVFVTSFWRARNLANFSHMTGIYIMSLSLGEIYLVHEDEGLLVKIVGQDVARVVDRVLLGIFARFLQEVEPQLVAPGKVLNRLIVQL